jgi:hypothetical protein
MRPLCNAFDRYAITRWFTLTLVIVLGVEGSLPAAEETKPNTPSSQPISSLEWLPKETIGFLVMRPKQVAQQKGLGPLAETISKNFADRFGVSLIEFDIVIKVVDPTVRPTLGIWSYGYILSSTKPIQNDPQLQEGHQKLNVGDKSFSVNSATGDASFTADERTRIVGRRSFVELILRNDRQSKSALVSSEAWNEVTRGPIAMAIDVPRLFQFIRLHKLLRTDPDLLPAFVPLWQETRHVHVGVNVGNNLSLLAFLEPSNAAKSAAIKETLEAAVTLGRNMTKEWLEAIPAEEAGGVYKPINDLLRSAQVDTQGARVRLRASMVLDSRLPALIVRQVQAARIATKQNVSRQNLREIALAIHNHHDRFKRFPASSNATTKANAEGQPCSWRVMILPYLEEETLYNAYHFDEPWDSENNKEILAKMPEVFRHPLDAVDSTNTSYFALTGPSTVFYNDKGTAIKEIADGMSRTIMIAEAKRAVPWTKPEDIEYSVDKPLPELGGWFEGGFNAALCDGSVWFFGKKVDESEWIYSRNIDESVLRALITRGGREPIDLGKVPQ